MTSKKKTVPVEVIRKWLSSNDQKVREIAMNVCAGRDVPLDIVGQGLEDICWDVREAAIRACAGQDIPMEIILDWLSGSSWHMRKAAMNACTGRDVPMDVIRKGLEDEILYVRESAADVCKANGIDVPVIRTVELPEQVFVKCCGGVIAVVEIPKDAQVRGAPGSGCRADKAVIKEVIGEFHGENVGISAHDETTSYYAGDIIEIDNFDTIDMTRNAHPATFRFFRTRKQAERSAL